MAPKDPKDFVSLLREQLRFLRNDDYAYERITFYLAGDPEGLTFSYQDEFRLDPDHNVLVVTEGPTDELENDGVPETVLLLSSVVASQLE